VYSSCDGMLLTVNIICVCVFSGWLRESAGLQRGVIHCHHATGQYAAAVCFSGFLLWFAQTVSPFLASDAITQFNSLPSPSPAAQPYYNSAKASLQTSMGHMVGLQSFLPCSNFGTYYPSFRDSICRHTVPGIASLYIYHVSARMFALWGVRRYVSWSHVWVISCFFRSFPEPRCSSC
jgi:hypothetical protein